MKLGFVILQMSLETPWDCPRALEWDQMTLQQFIDKTCWFQYTKAMATITSRAAFATEPSNVSFLYFLWYIKAGGGRWYSYTELKKKLNTLFFSE